MKNIIIILSVLLLSSCGIYNFAIVDDSGASTIQIKTFEDYSSLAPPTLPLLLSDQLTDMIIQQSKLELIKSNAELKFEGAVIGYTVSPENIQSGETAAQNRLTITVKVTYENTIEPHKSFEKNISNFTTYDSSNDLASVENDLIETISEQLVLDIYNASLGNW